VVRIGLLYLVYRGFRRTRWLPLIIATESAVAAGALGIRNGWHGAFPNILLFAVGTLAPAAGVAILLVVPAVRAFFTYQLGGKVPDTN